MRTEETDCPVYSPYTNTHIKDDTYQIYTVKSESPLSPPFHLPITRVFKNIFIPTGSRFIFETPLKPLLFSLFFFLAPPAHRPSLLARSHPLSPPPFFFHRAPAAVLLTPLCSKSKNPLCITTKPPFRVLAYLRWYQYHFHPLCGGAQTRTNHHEQNISSP